MAVSAGVLLEALGGLRDAAEAVRLPLDAPGVGLVRRTRRDVGLIVGDYLLPRAEWVGGPLLVVVGGATGVGKSTLVNSVVRGVVSPAGVVRPTTRDPVVVCHPDDFAVVGGGGWLLPGVIGPVIRPVVRDEVPSGVVLLDAPDINSVVEANRVLGERLMAAADVLVMVTSAERYADAVPWRQLKRAVERRTPVVVVLDRVAPGEVAEVQDACAALLQVNGLPDAPLFVVPETALEGGLLPSAAVFPLVSWLRVAGGDAAVRAQFAGAAVAGRIDALGPLVSRLAAGADGQWQTFDLLQQVVEQVRTAERVRFSDELEAGEFFGGELLIRWQELLGAGRIHALLQAGGASARAGASVGTAILPGSAADAPALRSALISAAAQAFRAALDHSRRTISDEWLEIPGGPELRPAVDSLDPVAAAISWLEQLPGAVRDQTRSKRSGRVVAGSGARGAGLLLGVAAVAGPVDSADRATAAAHGLIQTLFGHDDAARLLSIAQVGLRDACATLLERAADYHRAQLSDYGIRPHLADVLRAAQQEVLKNW